MNSIQDLFAGKYTELDKVYTTSGHSKVIKQSINDLMIENTRWQKLLLAIAYYPLQAWAKQTREKLNLVDEKSGLYFGINRSMYGHHTILNISDQMLEYISAIFENDIEGADINLLRAAHIPGSKDMSQYLFAKEYKKTLKAVCIKYCDNYSSLSSELVKEYKRVYDDIRFVYHDGELLITIKKELIKNDLKSDIPDSENLDYTKAISHINSCINSIREFPIKGEDISDVMMMYSNGYTESKIVQETGKSRTYVKCRYNEGIDLLNALLWGYSSKNIIRTSMF